MPSTVPNAAIGAKRSRQVAGEKADRLADEVYRWIRRISVAHRLHGGEPLGATHEAIAAQLNARGLRTNRDKLFDRKKVGAAFNRLGFDPAAISRWRERAARLALDRGWNQSALIHQLWHEWSWLQKKAELRGTQTASEVNGTMPPMVDPADWLPPWIREWDFRVQFVPAASQAARLAHDFFWDDVRAYEPSPADRERWEAARTAERAWLDGQIPRWISDIEAARPRRESALPPKLPPES